MKISIITATYNSAATLEDTIKSVLSQTYSDFEYVVVDGASTDETLDIVKRYEKEFDGRLVYSSEKDQGIYDAMNRGIAMATGDVIGILGSDDFFTSNDILEKVAEALADENIDAVYGDIHYVKPDNLQKSIRCYSSKNFRPFWMRFGFMPAHPSFYCRKSIYDKYGTFDISYPVSADFENLLRLLYIHKIRTRYLALDFVTMRTGGASSSGYKSVKAGLRDRSRALRENHVYSNKLFLCSLYVYKFAAMHVYRLKKRF